MKVIIAGSRTYQANKARQYVLDAINDSGWAGDITEIVHGGARGIDAAAHDVCEGQWPVKVFPADWMKHGKAAGPIRNREMADYADALIAVWDGKSRGTASMIAAMMDLSKPVLTFRAEANT